MDSEVTVQDFIYTLNDRIRGAYPHTTIRIVSGSDYMKDTLMELSESDKRLRYFPYRLFHASPDHDKTIAVLLERWGSVLRRKNC